MPTGALARDLLAGAAAGAVAFALLVAGVWLAAARFTAGAASCGPPVAGAQPIVGVDPAGADPCATPGTVRLVAGVAALLASAAPVVVVARSER
jgi:hypothetical protein